MTSCGRVPRGRCDTREPSRVEWMVFCQRGDTNAGPAATVSYKSREPVQTSLLSFPVSSWLSLFLYSYYLLIPSCRFYYYHHACTYIRARTPRFAHLLRATTSTLSFPLPIPSPTPDSALSLPLSLPRPRHPRTCIDRVGEIIIGLCGGCCEARRA